LVLSNVQTAQAHAPSPHKSQGYCWHCHHRHHHRHHHRRSLWCAVLNQMLPIELSTMWKHERKRGFVSQTVWTMQEL
jgi:hypothetical protein